MERGGRFHRYRRHAKHSPSSATSSGANSQQSNNTPTTLPNTLGPNTTSNGGGYPAAEGSNNLQLVQQNQPVAPAPAPCVVREQDQYMPIANVIRIMRRILPPHAQISDDAKETIQECVSGYISFITGEANDRCQKEQRKTITAEDVLWAMGKLGFDDYVEPLNLFLNRYRDNESDRSSSHHHHRDPYLKRSGAGFVDYGMNHGMPPPQFAPSYPMPPPPPAVAAPGQNMFDGGMMSGYYRDPTDPDGGTSNNPSQLLHYDPFAQFK